MAILSSRRINHLKWISFLKVIRLIYGIKIKLATSISELEQVYKVRYLAYKNAEIIVPSEIDGEILFDDFEINSFNIMATKSNIVIGTIRLTLSNSKKAFPHEEIFNVELPFTRKNTVEIGKFAVLPAYRKYNRVIAFGLTLYATQFSIRNEFSYWIFATNNRLKKSFERLGSEIYTLDAKMKDINEIKRITRNWKFYLKSPCQYYWLNVYEIKPNFGKREKTKTGGNNG